jgi:hypothetical protein
MTKFEEAHHNITTTGKGSCDKGTCWDMFREYYFIFDVLLLSTQGGDVG